VSLQRFRAEYFAPGTAGFYGECSWPECHAQAEWMELHSWKERGRGRWRGRWRTRHRSYCNEHADKRRKILEAKRDGRSYDE
jgi:hypothetical protein